MIEIQINTATGDWKTARKIPDVGPQYTLRQMQAVKATNPKLRVRAVDSNGFFLDMI